MNNRNLIFLLCLLFCGTFFTACEDEEMDDTTVYEEIVAVANRAGGSISFVDATSNQVISTLSIPGSEPMYAVYVPSNDRIYVGDRAQQSVHVIDPATRSVESSIAVGEGVFHMWADGQGNQLWVNNDIDNTISVIDLSSNTVTQTISLDAKPHDVFVNAAGTRAYVSILDSEATNPDKVYMFSTSNYDKTGEVEVGKDPHLFHQSNNNRLFVPCQSGELYALNGNDLSVESNLSLEGAHGIFGSPDQAYVYVANISGNQLYTVNPSDNTQMGTPVSSQASTPHNITVNESGNKMFVTHSGAMANTLSVYSLDNGSITPETALTIDTNPFGLTYYRRAIN